MTPEQKLHLADLRVAAQKAHVEYLEQAQEYGVTALDHMPIDIPLSTARARLVDLQMDRSLTREDAFYAERNR